jgi:hypothetical protein
MKVDASTTCAAELWCMRSIHSIKAWSVAATAVDRMEAFLDRQTGRMGDGSTVESYCGETWRRSIKNTRIVWSCCKVKNHPGRVPCPSRIGPINPGRHTGKAQREDGRSPVQHIVGRNLHVHFGTSKESSWARALLPRTWLEGRQHCITPSWQRMGIACQTSTAKTSPCPQELFEKQVVRDESHSLEDYGYLEWIF